MKPAADDDQLRARLRLELVESLISSGDIISDSVASAFREVDRHQFTRVNDVSESYANRSVATLRNESGEALTTVSAPWLQARMLESTNLSAGMRVLEIGSGGYNASLISRIVGTTGTVHSVDIDTTIIGYAAEALSASNSGNTTSNIELHVADAWDETLDFDTDFDAIIVTVDSWTIPSIAWRRLRIGGRIVVPLRPFGLPLTISFRRQSETVLESTGAIWSGFVSGRGLGSRPNSGILMSTTDGDILFDAEGEPTDAHWLVSTLQAKPRICRTDATFPAGYSLSRFMVWMLAGGHNVGTLRTHDGKRTKAFPWISPHGTPAWLTSNGIITLALHESNSTNAFDLFIYAYGQNAEDDVARMRQRANQWADSDLLGSPSFQIEHQAQAASASTGPTIARGKDRILLSWTPPTDGRNS
ncbi:hypothetical protein [Brachybacterium sp. UMB0905]|uniref:hypothetical protein n=1 Tax=Brachybacterium sp. UMB0905 TaxID=2069310 RepID=UPI001303FA4B